MFFFLPFSLTFLRTYLLTSEPVVATLQDHSNIPGHLLNLWLVPLGDDNGNGNLEGAVWNFSTKSQNNFAIGVLLSFTQGIFAFIFEA